MTIAPEQPDRHGLRDATEVRFSIRAMLITMAVLAVALSALSAFIQHFPSDARPRLAVLWGMLGVILLALFVYHARCRYVAELQAGRVLFSLVPHSYFIPHAPDFARLCCGVCLLAVAPVLWVTYSFAVAATPTGVWWLPFPIDPYMFYGLLGSGAGLTCLWWRRVRVTENGLVVRSRFVPWGKCYRWYWDACNKNVVVINYERLTHLALIVPAEHRATINSMLKNKVVIRRLNEPAPTQG